MSRWDDHPDPEVRALAASRDALAASLATLREAVLRFDATEDVGDDIEKASDALTAALAATASPAEHGERVLREAERTAAVRALRWVRSLGGDENTLRWLDTRADAIEAGKEPTP